MSIAQISFLFKTQNRKDVLSPMKIQPLEVGEQDVTDRYHFEIQSINL